MRYAPRLRVVMISALAVGGVSSVAAAQLRQSQSIVGVTNAEISNFVGSLDSENSNTGALTTASVVDQTFTGLDRTNVQRTMTFSGQTQNSAQYGQLRSASSGTVSNTYYNEDNPLYYNSSAAPGEQFNTSGSPDGLVSLGFAIFEDTLQFGGELQAGYRARYVFHIDGTNSGYGSLVSMAVNIAGVQQPHFVNGDTGFISTNYATNSVEIAGTFAQTIRVQFSTQFVLNTFDVPDGTTDGGSANFGATATLTEIQVVDANDNPVDGVTITTASGASYGGAVPEPMSVTMLAFAVLGLRRARRACSVVAN